MQFRRITVRNFKKLLDPVSIDELQGGVTIIAGDNEEGKSTLLEAIRAGLFERHNVGGKAIENMQPFGSTVRPEIELEFEIDGEAYTISKGFAQKPSARLSTPNGTFEGPAAEEKLAELLRFRLAQYVLLSNVKPALKYRTWPGEASSARAERRAPQGSRRGRRGC